MPVNISNAQTITPPIPWTAYIMNFLNLFFICITYRSETSFECYTFPLKILIPTYNIIIRFCRYRINHPI